MPTKNITKANIKEIDSVLVEERLDAITKEVTKDLTSKANAFYLPSNERAEKETLSRVVSSLQSSIEAKKLNSKNGKRASYEEDDLMEYMNDAEFSRAVELKNKPYFARLNYAKNGEKLGEVLYIGEENLAANIKSWKEPIAQLYYKKSFHEKIEIDRQVLELDMIRELTIERGELKILHPEQRKVLEVDPHLVEKLAAKKGAEMHALIDSLQAEQYELIQLPITQPIVVQGSAGSGKSVIALHRLSYLLYNYKQLEAKRIAIIGPNKLFLNHIKNVLPELGEQQIVQTTLQEFLETRLGLINKIQQVDQLILSEVQDLSVKDGREQALKDYHAYAHMREVKGSLAYKNYIERYSEYIVADLSPFIKNLTHGPFTISGIEIAYFMDNTTHLGDSKEQLKHFISTTFNNRISVLNQIHQTLTNVITKQVNLFIEAIQRSNLLPLTSQMIEEQKEVVKNQYQHIQLVQAYINYRNYRQILSSQDLEEIALIKDVKDQEAHTKKLVNKKLVDANHKLSDYKQQLDQMIGAFIKEQIQPIVENAAQLIVMEGQATTQIKAQFEHYCQLMHKSYIFAQATDMLEQSGYVSSQLLKELVEELESSLLTDLNDSWTQQKVTILSNLNSKLKQELTGHLAQRLEEVILTAHRDLKEIQFFLRPLHKHQTVFTNETIPDFTTIFDEIDSFYVHTVEGIYKQIIHDQHEVAHKLAQDIDIEILSQYTIIEKHDLPALYSIHKLIEPSAEPPLQYAIIDEAQDYSLYEMTVFKDLTEQIMLMGDLGQNISPGNPLKRWEEFEQVIGPFGYYELKATFRSTKQIVDFANDIIKDYSKGKYSLPQIAFRNGEDVKRISRSGSGVYSSMREVIDELLEKGSEEARTVIIAKTHREAQGVYEQLNHPDVQLQLDTEFVDAKVVITTPVLAKGLEFDNVLLFRFSSYSKTDECDSKLAYVAASRALHKLYVYS